MRRVRCFSAVVKVKTTTAPGGQVTLVESGQCLGSQSESKTVTRCRG
jgi:hypothetical protein